MISTIFNIRKQVMKFLIIISFFSIVTLNVGAHPPSKMNIKYDTEIQNLDVEITHQVNNPNSHYIFKIEIKKNDKTYDIINYTNQLSENTFTYNYNIDADENDEIEVTAYCNIAGSITKKLTVATGESQSDDSSTPGFELYLLIIGIFVLLICRRTERN